MQQSYDQLCAYLKRASGLILDSSKHYLVESRVLPIVRRENLSGLAELVRVLEEGRRPALSKEIVEAMTINETYFFRDRAPFDAFRDTALPKLIQARASERKLRIWCAASSTGQEPYSIAIILEEMAAKIPGWRLEIVATDIAEPVLAKARAATYSQFEVQRGLTTPQLLKHFTQTGESWQLSTAVRSKVSFRQLNLLTDFSALGKFDVIFCRNVLIYFEVPTKEDILRRMTRLLATDGYLILGASESVLGMSTTLVPHPEQRLFHIHAGVAGTTALPAFPLTAPGKPAQPVAAPTSPAIGAKATVSPAMASAAFTSKSATATPTVATASPLSQPRTPTAPRPISPSSPVRP